jgi:hypothetical protein
MRILSPHAFLAAWTLNRLTWSAGTWPEPVNQPDGMELRESVISVLPGSSGYGRVKAMNRVAGLIGSALLALSVVALHGVATPTASGACARADIHHSMTDTIDINGSLTAPESAVDANAAYLKRDHVPLRLSGVAQYEYWSVDSCGLSLQSGNDPPAPDLIMLSRWRT